MKEYVDFLSGQSPYDALDPEELTQLVRRLDVEFVTAGTVILAPEADPVSTVWVVRTGLVELVIEGRVTDQLSVGDSFGSQPGTSVRAAENSLLYLLPDLREVLEQRLRLPGDALAGTSIDIGLGSVSRFARPIIWCEPETTLQAAARRISDAGTSCALVYTDRGVAIVTDSDIRRAVGDGFGPASLVAASARTPVLSVAEDAAVATAFLRMLEHGVHHLVLTSRSGRPTGVVRVVDLTSARIRDPLLVREAVRGASTLDELRVAGRMLRPTAVELMSSGVPATEAATMLAAVTESIVRRVVEGFGVGALRQAQETDGGAGQGADGGAGQGTEGKLRSLLVLGSLARRETLPLSDFDTALIGADPTGWAENVISRLESCGLPRGVNGANAADHRFSRVPADWRALADAGPGDDARTRMLVTVTADARPITEVAYGQSVLDALAATLHRAEWREPLARHALVKRPPAGFVGDLVVDQAGDHQPALDLRTRGLGPLVALGQWLGLQTDAGPRGTPERFRRALDAGLLTVTESDALIGAHADIFSLLMVRETESIRAGAPTTDAVAVTDLDTATRRRLRDAFRAVAGVQHELARSWRTRTEGIGPA